MINIISCFLLFFSSTKFFEVEDHYAEYIKFNGAIDNYQIFNIFKEKEFIIKNILKFSIGYSIYTRKLRYYKI